MKRTQSIFVLAATFVCTLVAASILLVRSFPGVPRDPRNVFFAERALPKAINIVDRAHPILAALAIPAFLTRNDLLANCVISDLKLIEFPRALTQCHHLADEFVPHDHRHRNGPAAPIRISGLTAVPHRVLA
jgi:hypothetical protein